MEMLYLMLFFIALLAVSFIRLLITNSAIYAVKVRKFTDKKRFILKASVMLNIDKISHYIGTQPIEKKRMGEMRCLT